MWISQSEYSDIKDRLRMLEARMATFECVQKVDIQNVLEFTVYEDGVERDCFERLGIFMEGAPNSVTIPLRSVVQQILDHLELKLRYVKGEPTRAEIQKKPKGK